ncbi:hypothetical protein NDU88_007056 [Pleurodeles waltl]|uniref:SWIM-type domain-containing protein n=1 Tax=Pleurodeles waltl TaxID=8319 RepID=A0AAV7SR87_PLEWA|nr:hypothetical protein NDU88_007056 [Pleurodeles waltl]
MRRFTVLCQKRFNRNNPCKHLYSVFRHCNISKSRGKSNKRHYDYSETGHKFNSRHSNNSKSDYKFYIR